jgi:hypothetical protein
MVVGSNNDVSAIHSASILKVGVGWISFGVCCWYNRSTGGCVGSNAQSRVIGTVDTEILSRGHFCAKLPVHWLFWLGSGINHQSFLVWPVGFTTYTCRNTYITHFDPEDGGSMHLRNVNTAKIYTMQEPKTRMIIINVPRWKPEIKFIFIMFRILYEVALHNNIYEYIYIYTHIYVYNKVFRCNFTSPLSPCFHVSSTTNFVHRGTSSDIYRMSQEER